MREADLATKTDEELMVLYQNGNASAFELLYARNGGRVFAYYRNRVSQERAADLTQEVFFKVHRSRQLYNQQYPFLPWLFAIVRNVLIDSQRGTGERISQASTDKIPEISSEKLGERTGSVDFDWSTALERLPPSQRLSIELRYLKDWSFEDIAREIQSSPSNVRQLISRGLRALKKNLGGAK